MREPTLQILRQAIVRQSAAQLAIGAFILLGIAIGVFVLIAVPRGEDGPWTVMGFGVVLALMAAGAWPLWRGGLRGIRPALHPVYEALTQDPARVISVAEEYRDVEVRTEGVVVTREVSTFHFLLGDRSRHRIAVPVPDAGRLAAGLREILPHATVSEDPKRPNAPRR